MVRGQGRAENRASYSGTHTTPVEPPPSSRRWLPASTFGRQPGDPASRRTLVVPASRMRFRHAVETLALRSLAGGLGKADVVEHQLMGSLVSLEKIARKAKEIAKPMEEGADATLTSDGMKLNFGLKGELEIQDGITDHEDLEAGNNVCYIPPGYVEKEVRPSSVSGTVKLSPSLTRFGMLEDATLEFEEGKIVTWTSRASPGVLTKLAEVLPQRSPKLAALVVGLNPTMKFGFGQDRFPAGSVSLLLGFTGILRRANLEVGGKTVVKDGRLS